MRQTNRPLSMQFSEFHNEVELNDIVIQQKELSNLQRNMQLAWLCSGKEDTDRKSMEQSKMIPRLQESLHNICMHFMEIGVIVF